MTLIPWEGACTCGRCAPAGGACRGLRALSEEERKRDMAQQPDRCVQPGFVTDDDLLACARGEAPRSVVAHVAACPACRARVAGYEALERRLLAGLFAPRCPESLTLAEFALDLLPAEQQAEVRNHLTRCPHCRAVVRSIRARPGSPGASAAPTEDKPPPDAAGWPRAVATVAVSARAGGITTGTAAQGARLGRDVRCARRPGGVTAGRL